MYARVARWEGGDAETIRSTVSDISTQAQSGPPEGVPGKGFMLLSDPDGGKVTAIALFESEDDYRQGDQTLNEMSPPGDGMGSRVSVEKYEVGVKVDL
jgi:hypothetical protein